MNKEKKRKKITNKFLGIMLFGLILSSVGVSAFWSNRGQTNEEILEAIENEDYEAWKTAMSDSINEENFQNIIEFRNNQTNKGNFGQRNGLGNKNINNSEIRINRQMNSTFLDLRELTRQAIEDNDYEAYIKAIESYEGELYNEMISLEDFETLVELHNARISEGFNLEKGNGFHRFERQREIETEN
ncbi:MAG: hypothetical protein PHT94_03920 [Candidatus Nanoarchaeia archaeon]|nr:hypothetical protein [Candidatus Nanoarchaeia archaeon]